MNAEQKRNLLEEARKRLKWAIEDDQENRNNALEDLEFIMVPGAQWPSSIRLEREANGQPCLEINKMTAFIDQVVGNQRMNRPTIKVLPVDDKSDPETARILGGWIKHVERISVADEAYDHAFEHAVMCGYGALRVVTDYISDQSMDQEAYIQKIDNALAVYWGRHSRYDCADADYCFIVSDVQRDEYKDSYGREPMPFNYTDSRYVEGWCTKNTVRVAEYFRKVKETKKLYLLDTGETTDKPVAGDVIVKERTVDATKIEWYLLSGDDILDSRDWCGKKYIPVVPVWGKEANVGGRRHVRGLIRMGKDAQRMYNYWSSSDTESIALQPRAPFIVTARQIEGYENMWKEAHKKNYPFLIYTPDAQAPGAPQRQSPALASSAMTSRIAMADQEMRDTIGLQKASLGMQSNERSGAAIRERKMEGDTGTFAFIDNLARSIEHIGRILLDVSTSILDTERVVRIGLTDESFEFDSVNKHDGMDILNDVSVGTYDVVVSVGPSFATQRIETQQSMREFIQYVPSAGPLIADIYASTMDWPRHEEFKERLQLMLPPEVQAKIEQQELERLGPEGEEQLAQIQQQQQQGPPPDPEAMMRLQIEQMKLKEMELKLAQQAEQLKYLQIKNEMLVMSGKESVKRIVREILRDGNAKGNEGGQSVSPAFGQGEVEGFSS